MRLPRFLRRLLRVSLAWKIAGANALLLIVLAGGIFLMRPEVPAATRSSELLIAVILAAATINVGLITLALRPIHELERVAEQVWSGATDVRVAPSRLADPDLSRVAHTINELLEQLSADRTRLQKLTQKLLAARSSERAAFSYELTESIAQSVAAMSFELAALNRSSRGSSNGDQLERLGRATTGLLEEIRRLARDVYPRHLDQLGLEAALRSLVREAATAKAIDVSFEPQGQAAGPGALSREVADTLYDVAREAIRNACQHSGADRIEVSLGLERHVVRLSVSDDGCGFNIGAVDPNRGLGLSLIRERLSLVGGNLEVVSTPGKGTRVEAVVPLSRQAVNEPNVQEHGANQW